MKSIGSAKQALIRATRASTLMGYAIPKHNRAFILDPFFKAAGGHHLNFNLSVRGALAERGWSVTIFANRYASAEVISMTRSRRLFASPAYEEFRPCLDALFKRNVDFYRDLKTLGLVTFRPENVVLLHSVTIFELIGLARWYEELDASRRPRLIVYLQFPPSYGVGSERRDVLIAHKCSVDVVERLRCFSGVTLCTSSARIAAAFALGDVEPRLVPLPISWSAGTNRQTRRNRLVFGYIGSARPEKGFHLLADAISAVLADVDDVEFLISAPRNPAFDANFDRLRKLGPRVGVRDRFSSARDDYYALYDDVDCVIAPYDPAVYQNMTSMIAVEAIGMGKGLIATRGTWLAEFIADQRGFGAIMAEFTAAALANAVRCCRANWVKGEDTRLAAAANTRAAHQIDNFLNCIGVQSALAEPANEVAFKPLETRP